MGVLPAALGGDIGHRALQDFQQGLLHALAGDIPGDGGIFTLSGDFIHLVDVNNPPLRLLDVIVGIERLECGNNRRRFIGRHGFGGYCQGKGAIHERP